MPSIAWIQDVFRRFVAVYGDVFNPSQYVPIKTEAMLWVLGIQVLLELIKADHIALLKLAYVLLVSNLYRVVS